jgi:hypothetical protein
MSEENSSKPRNEVMRHGLVLREKSIETKTEKHSEASGMETRGEASVVPWRGSQNETGDASGRRKPNKETDGALRERAQTKKSTAVAHDSRGRPRPAVSFTER